jgi:ribosomal protein S18 acetylase RimI-like enzyme
MVKFRAATTEDNLKLIQLTATSAMAGDIGLRIDRKPDFFALLEMRGETKVFVAEENEQIIGAICVSLSNVYVGGEIFPLQYIGDFKVAERYRHQGIGLKLCNEMAEYVISQNSDLAFLNVSKGNTKPLSFFKNRPNVPDFDNIGIFNIYQIIGKRIAASSHKYSIEETKLTDDVLQFFNSHYSNYELAPVLTQENFNSTSIFIIRESERIIAAMTIVDTMSVKQNVVTALSWKFKFALKVINIFAGVSGFSKMPELNQPVKMLYIKYLAVESNRKLLVKLFVNYARNLAFKKSYSYVSIGLHEKDKLKDCLSRLPKLTFKSVGMLLSIKNNRSLVDKVKEGVPYEDYSLV